MFWTTCENVITIKIKLTNMQRMNIFFFNSVIAITSGFSLWEFIRSFKSCLLLSNPSAFVYRILKFITLFCLHSFSIVILSNIFVYFYNSHCGRCVVIWTAWHFQHSSATVFELYVHYWKCCWMHLDLHFEMAQMRHILLLWWYHWRKATCSWAAFSAAALMGQRLARGLPTTRAPGFAGYTCTKTQ